MEQNALKTLIKKAENIIFDFDGIIVDSEYYFYLSAKKAFSEIKCLEESYYYKYWTNIGNGLEKESKGLGLSKEEEKSIKRKIERNYMGYVKKGLIKSYEEILPILTILKKGNKKLYIASNTKKEILNKLLDDNNIPREVFSGVFGKTKNMKPKPHPDIFVHTLAEINANPDKTIVIEDTEKGVVSAEKAGIRSISIRNRHNITAEFSQCEHIFKSHKDLLFFLNSAFDS